MCSFQVRSFEISMLTVHLLAAIINEMAVLRRTERAMVRAMCGAKLMEKKRTEDLMEMLGLKETMVQMAKANGVRWYVQACVEEG